jgi:FixJ family two-component response regulator
MKREESIVYVVDDDARVRQAMEALLRSSNRKVKTFTSAAQYLESIRPDDVSSCLVLDIDMPEMSGLELQQKLLGQDGPPIIFLTGFGDIPSTVKAMKAGASEFFTKPVDDMELLQAIEQALAVADRARSERSELSEIQRRYSLLTPREREVLPYVVAGLLNKQTAGELGTSEITIRIHRGQIMRKMQAESLADLVRIAAKLSISLPQTPYTKR